MIKINNFLLLGVLIMMMTLLGCSIITEENNLELYSRADTEDMCESSSFGINRNDDIYTALNFIYSDKTIREKHGSDFEITTTDIVCHSSEGKSYFFPGLYKGQAEYSVTIDSTTYKVYLSKKTFGTWIVTECLPE